MAERVIRPSTGPAELPEAGSILQGLAFEALGDAWRLSNTIFDDTEACAMTACAQAIVLQLADVANELRANRERMDTALARSFGPGALEEELQPNGEGYRSASAG